MSNPGQQGKVHFFLGILGLLSAILVSLVSPGLREGDLIALALFTLLVVLAARLGFPLDSGYVSMAHIIILAALLASGAALALWVAVVGFLLAEILQPAFAWFLGQPPHPWRQRFSTALSRIGLHALSTLVAAGLFLVAGGELPWRFPPPPLPLLVLFFAYFLAHSTFVRLLVSWEQGLTPAHRTVEAPFFHYSPWITLPLVYLLPLPFALLFAYLYLKAAFSLLLLTGLGLALFSALSGRLQETRHRLEKRVQELQTLGRIGQMLGDSLDLDILLETLYQHTVQLMEVDRFVLALYDVTTDEITFPLIVEEGQRQHQGARPLGNRLIDYLIRTREPLLLQGNVPDFLEAHGLEGTTPSPRAWLGVPLIARDQVLGAIVVQNHHQSDAYGPSDREILSLLAAQAAVAIENARLYGQMRRRAAELALLNTVSTAVGSTLDLDRVLEIVTTSVIPVMGCQKSAIFLLDTDAGAMRLAASHELQEAYIRVSQTIPLGGGSRVLAAMEGKPVIVPDIEADSRFADLQELARKEGFRAFADIPLISRDQLIGVLSIYYIHPHRFTLAERDLLTTFANQAAAAIANARLYARTDQALARRVEELAAIEAIGRQLASTLAPERVIEMVLEHAMIATGATQGSIAMVDTALEQVQVVVHRGFRSDTPQSQARPLTEGIVGRVIRTGQVAMVSDVRQDPDHVALDPQVRSQLTVPIVRSGEVLGVINLESHKLDAFDHQDLRFVQHLATQAAVALENAQLFQESNQRVLELSQLYQASLALASSLDLPDLLAEIGRIAQQLTRSDGVTLYLYDKEQDEFIRASVAGSASDEGADLPIRPHGITRQIVASQEPVLIQDTLTYPDISPYVLQHGIRSLIGVPLVSRGEVLGVLYVNSHRPHAYSANEVRLVSALASQAAAAIATARLFEQVRQGRDRLEAILNSTREGILMLDNSGRILMANSQIEALFGVSAESLLGKVISRAAGDGAEDLAVLLGYQIEDGASHLLAAPSQRPQVIEVPGPQTRFLQHFSTPVLNDAGQVIGQLLVFRDITEEKELERMREELTDMIIHDLRSPLTAIMGGLRLVKDGVTDDETNVQALEVAERSCQHMLNLVELLLTISRLEAGEMPIEQRPEPLPPLIRTATSQLRPLAVDRGVLVREEISDGLPMVNVDREQIERVLLNLLDNALKFTPMGGEVVIRVEPLDNHFIRCAVRDTGPGIPEEFQDRVFDRFFQVPNRASMGRHGSGLGLAFCKLAVEAHGGRIWVETPANGPGSIFYFTLPTADLPPLDDE